MSAPFPSGYRSCGFAPNERSRVDARTARFAGPAARVAPHRADTRREATAEADSELLLRVLCHEFRTPVSTLTSLTRALADERRELTSDDRRAISELARDQAAHLQSLLRDATAGTGALTLTPQPEPVVALAGILREAAALVPAGRRRARATRRAASCPVPAGRTRQVLVNLVQNALRHGPPNGQVGLYATVRGPGVSILVTDEGGSTMRCWSRCGVRRRPSGCPAWACGSSGSSSRRTGERCGRTGCGRVEWRWRCCCRWFARCADPGGTPVGPLGSAQRERPRYLVSGTEEVGCSATSRTCSSRPSQTARTRRSPAGCRRCWAASGAR